MRMSDAVTPQLHVCEAHYLATGEAAGKLDKGGSPGFFLHRNTGVNTHLNLEEEPEEKRAAPPQLRAGMSEEAMRQTRSQKRALERDSLPVEVDSKKVKMEKGDHGKGETGVPDGLKVTGILKAGEVKATIKVEVQTREEPVDMSTSKSEVERRPPSPDDVIVLSDNEPSSPRVNGLNHCSREMDTELLMKSCPSERERIIKQLKEELRLEEAKLVLLKKLRQSQIQKEGPAQKAAGSSGSVATPPPLVRGSITASKGAIQVTSGRNSGAVIPPPLVRGGQQISAKLGSHNAQIVMPPLVRGAQVQGLRQQQHSSSGGPPPLLLAPRASVPSMQVQGQRIIQQGLIRVANVPNTSVLVNIPQAPPTNLKGSSVTSQSALANCVTAVGVNDSPASRQAAAKLALRKQLEKTLLEIPPPKPTTPDLNFLPSAANNEFIYLVGLEEVVQNLLDTVAKGKLQASQVSSTAPAPKEPFTCAQCKTDFTSCWRQDKSGTVMCEQCTTSNQKKVLKAEHTNRLKAAFVKALQQEQEIEQRIMQQSLSASPATKTPPVLPAIKVEQQTLGSQQLKQARPSPLQPQPSRGAIINRHHSTVKQSPGQPSRSAQAMGGRAASHSISQAAQLHSGSITAAALVSRPGKHAVHAGGKVNSSRNAAVEAWRKRSAATQGVTMAYVNPSLSQVHKSSSAVDRHREYLLDMIPSRSISQTANTWK
ncbi:transcriptional repressor p66-alpha-like isoform X2 [Brienomyrus brachyistius]|uniref:transcriptional repressor p66-alpha-like isoform X2 n=1 Tax=Brienomyrus brachyistius TaxID=42636 RepID=UPI0020B35176|nr:transcriptional repressor p66-alpha-like isoform X2 [Brienomyrus brachyistius]